ncbi:UNVERIFIED_CONTAM: Retrovirus-related Pol polyprotein from transposon RE1 [Sesamum calycinum]|uniref:Retrovirus-related Pol polyprotein from transposon RE1 n=1 Tax=Sesamum calycinum TaxID=2727403 RepID=A0AAW2JJL7_9LAMI
MNAELKALENNHTWELVPLPPGNMAIGCRWVFKLKLKADGSVDRHKARLVAKGYNQVEEEIFMEAPDGYHVPDGHSKNDYCLFTKTSDLGFLVLLLYIDDILVAENFIWCPPLQNRGRKPVHKISSSEYKLLSRT